MHSISSGKLTGASIELNESCIGTGGLGIDPGWGRVQVIKPGRHPVFGKKRQGIGSGFSVEVVNKVSYVGFDPSIRFAVE